MKTCGVQTVVRHVMKPMTVGTTFPIALWGDVHWGTEHLSKPHWDRFVNWGRRQKNLVTIGMGDYVDMGGAKERDTLATIGAKGLRIQTIARIRKVVEDLNDEMRADLKWMVGNCAGLLDGNHFLPDGTGTTMTQRLCTYLKCPWLGVSSLIRIVVPVAGNTNKMAKLDVFVHHGRGAGRKKGSSINSVDDMKAVAGSMDIYCMGHDHQRWAADSENLTIRAGKGPIGIGAQKQLLCRSGSFLRTYLENVPSYGVDAMYAPAGLGPLIIWVTIERNFIGGIDQILLTMKAEV